MPKPDQDQGCRNQLYLLKETDAALIGHWEGIDYGSIVLPPVQSGDVGPGGRKAIVMSDSQEIICKGEIRVEILDVHWQVLHEKCYCHPNSHPKTGMALYISTIASLH